MRLTWQSLSVRLLRRKIAARNDSIIFDTYHIYYQYDAEKA